MALCYQVQSADSVRCLPPRTCSGRYASSVSEPIHVLHLLGTAEREGSGVAKIVAELAQNLNPKYKLHAWFLKSDGPLVKELRNCGADAHWIGWENGVRDPLGAMRFWRQLRSEDYALVHQHWGARSIRQLVRWGTNAKVVVHSHGRFLEEGELRCEPAAVRGADAIIAVSEFIAQQLPGKQVHVVYSGVRPSEPIRRRDPDRPDSLVIGTACRIIKAKGVRDLVSTFAGLNREFPTLRLEVAGAGPEEGSLFKLAQDLGLAHAVRFLGWVDDLRYVLRTWDVFALPSYDEALPISILEAMAEGLPVVATNVGGIPELVENERTGFLVPPGDVDALRRALHRLIEHSELRAKLGDQGRLRAETKFSVEQMVAEIESIYDALSSSE